MNERTQVSDAVLFEQGFNSTFRQRFWNAVIKTDGCWAWKLVQRPYGIFSKKRGDQIYAHRASWILHFGPIPDGLFCLHKCDNPPCTNPDHLFLGTCKENMQDCKRKGRTLTGDRNWTHNHPESTQGENNPRAKLTIQQVLEIRRRAEYQTGKSLAEEFGMGETAISRIISGKSWSCIHYT